MRAAWSSRNGGNMKNEVLMELLLIAVVVGVGVWYLRKSVPVSSSAGGPMYGGVTPAAQNASLSVQLENWSMI